MSQVPTWKRTLSGSEFVYQTYQLNKELGRILANKPKKYKQNYTDEIIRTALSAMKHLVIADGIYMSKYSLEKDYLLRRKCLQAARGEVADVAIACYVFLEIVRAHDYAAEGEHREDIAKLYDQEMKIGEMCETCYKLIGGVMKSDTEIYSKYIRPGKKG